MRVRHIHFKKSYFLCFIWNSLFQKCENCPDFLHFCWIIEEEPYAFFMFWKYFLPNLDFGFCRRCGIEGSERVPPSPLGWYWVSYRYFWWQRQNLIIWIFEIWIYCSIFEMLAYFFWQVIISFIGFKIMYSNIRSNGVPLLISGFLLRSQTQRLKGFNTTGVQQQ